MPTSLPIASLDRYFYADPASGKGKLKKISARQAIVGIGADHLRRIFVLFAWAGKLPTSKFRDKIIETYVQFTPKRFCIESNAMQELFGDLVRDEAIRRYGPVRIQPMPVPTKIEKKFKIRTAVQPIINDSRLFLLEDQVELISELQGHPTYFLDDLADALSMCIRMLPKRSLQDSGQEEIQRLAAYLRRTGVPSHIIQQRIQELQSPSGALALR